MNADHLETLRQQIETAHSLAEAKSLDVAAHLFAAARVLAATRVDQKKLNAEVQRQYNAYRKEREFYRKDVLSQVQPVAAGAAPGGPGIVVVSDSLGLPRPTAKDSPRQGAEHIYSNLLAQKFPDRAVTAICQRFFTTSDVIRVLEEEPELGWDSDFVLHLGLNDTARRMFLERQRIALSFVPEPVQSRIVSFGQRYRAGILKYLPALHYTPPEEYAANLDRIVTTLKARKARRIVFVTTILPPLKFWKGTPNVELYFAKYNVTLMSVALRQQISCLDFDRHVWASLNRNPLDPDGMHLSEFGHVLLSDELAKLLT